MDMNSVTKAVQKRRKSANGDGKRFKADEIVMVEEGNVFKFPTGSTPDEVALAAVAWAKQMEEVVSFSEPIRAAIPTEAAIVLTNIIRQKYPMLTMKGDFSMFSGYTPPEVVSVTVADGESYDILLGKLVLPGFSDNESLRIYIGGQGIVIECRVRRKREKAIKELIAEVQQRVTTSTIFEGKALRFSDISWVNGDREFDLVGDTPQVFNLDNVNEEWLILNAAEQSALQARIFGRITMNERYRSLGRKQGGAWLFSGVYGTGKSYAISVAMKKAVEAGWTVIQFDKASQFNEAIEIALKMQKTNNSGLLMIVEDVELVMPSDRKDESMTELSNLLDGANKSFQKTVLIMTTNEVDNIHPLFRRRCEIVTFEPPGRDAKIQLVTQFLEDWGGKSVDMDAVAAALTVPNSGDPVIFTPVFIELVCDSAIEQAIVAGKDKVTTQMILNAARVVAPQVLSVYRPEGKVEPTIQEQISQKVVSEISESLQVPIRNIKEIHEVVS